MDMNKKIIIRALMTLLSVLLSVEAIGYVIAVNASRTAHGSESAIKRNSLRSENYLLMEKIKNLHPSGPYISVDTAENILYLKEGQRTILKATVSCGSGSILSDPSDKRKWVFDTPRGVFSVQSRYVKPRWIKPDWAFIEEGESIPGNQNDRIEDGVLGDYALGIGNGYFIHGTLYTRLLGRNVTHGCIRVGDKDLKALYEKVPEGSKVLIF
jgi:L,D-transpeptidase YbiS